jgi:hypothetical protein
MANELMSTGQVARHFGVSEWRVNRVLERGLLARPERFGRYHMFRPADLPAVREALIKAGYLPQAPEGQAVAS